MTINSKRGKTFLKEFKDFTIFLQSVWGILAGISVLFPLSNVFVGVIPLDYVSTLESSGDLTYLSSQLVTAVTSLISLFVVFWTFGRRDKFRVKRRSRLIRRQAFISFAVGLLSLILYLVIYFGIYGMWYGPWEIWSDDPRRLVGDILQMITYSSFFALVTRAFMLLGMTEYFRKE